MTNVGLGRSWEYQVCRRSPGQVSPLMLPLVSQRRGSAGCNSECNRRTGDRALVGRLRDNKWGNRNDSVNVVAAYERVGAESAKCQQRHIEVAAVGVNVNRIGRCGTRAIAEIPEIVCCAETEVGEVSGERGEAA